MRKAVTHEYHRVGVSYAARGSRLALVGDGCFSVFRPKYRPPTFEPAASLHLWNCILYLPSLMCNLYHAIHVLFYSFLRNSSDLQRGVVCISSSCANVRLSKAIVLYLFHYFTVYTSHLFAVRFAYTSRLWFRNFIIFETLVETYPILMLIYCSVWKRIEDEVLCTDTRFPCRN